MLGFNKRDKLKRQNIARRLTTRMMLIEVIILSVTFIDDFVGFKAEEITPDMTIEDF